MYTVEAKIVLAGDFLNGVGWARREASVKRDKLLRLVKESQYVPIEKILRDALVHNEAPRARAELAARAPQPPHRRQYVADLLATDAVAAAAESDVDVRSAVEALRASLEQLP